MMVPHTLTMIPVYMMIADLQWFDTWRALVIPNLAMPFAVFLLRQHFRSFPRELFDAAEMDGAGHWRALWLVVLPNLKPVKKFKKDTLKEHKHGLENHLENRGEIQMGCPCTAKSAESTSWCA